MRAKVLPLRRGGVLIGVSLYREAFDKGTGVLAGHLEMTRGGHVLLRSENSSPGKGLIAELYDPKLIAVEHFWLHLRGIERGTVNQLEAGLLQEWVVAPGWN